MATIQRRVSTLETMASLTLLANLPPLTQGEIEAIVRRVEMRDNFTQQEVTRIERHGTICHGEFLIRVFQGNLVAKRYIGLDSSEI